jgi:long-chain fatty acid transport protein
MTSFSQRSLWIGLTFVLAQAGGAAYAQLGPALTGRMAQAENAAVVNNNPAGITYVDGTQVVLDGMFAHSFSDFEVKAGTTTSGGNPDDDDDPTIIPTFSFSHEITERLRGGFGVFFPAGIGSDYGDDWAGRYYAIDSTLVFLSLQPVLAYRVTDWLSLGAGPAIMYVASESTVAINNLQPGRADGRLELDVDGVGVGAIVSALVEPWEGTRFGIAYRNEQNPTLRGRPRFTNLGPLLAQSLENTGVLGAKIDLDINVPQSVQAGFYHRLSERLAVKGDVTWFDWSRFGRVDISVSSVSTSASQDYNDIWIGSVGTDYDISPELTVSSGFTYVSSAVDSEDRTLALPMDELYAFGIGGRYRVRPTLAVQLNLLGTISGNGRIDQQSNPLAGRLRGESDTPYSLALQIALVWGTEPH